jgi:hypothetical protein
MREKTLINLYFNSIDLNQKDLDIEAMKQFDVKEMKKTTVTVFEYYRPGKKNLRIILKETYYKFFQRKSSNCLLFCG